MHRTQPTECVSLPNDDNDDPNGNKQLSDERSKVTSFSWDMATTLFDRKTMERLGKANIYFMDDGFQINDENYLTCVTTEICREFGYELLDVLADLILPVGFAYPSLTTDLQKVVQDAFKPVSKIGCRKTVVWIDDEDWNVPSNSIVEPLVRGLLLKKIEPFLIAPMKYFDKQVLSTVFKVLDTSLEPESSDETNSWQSFTNLLKFGFLLTLRSSTFPFILLHFSQKLAEKVDAFQMLDLAEAEGHEVKYIKNISAEGESKETMVSNFVQKLVFTGSARKRMRLD